MNSQLYQELLEAKSMCEKKFAILIDPDSNKIKNLDLIISESKRAGVDYFFIGGSLLIDSKLEQVITKIKENCNIPCVLFPGNSFQLNDKADAVLFLSLISGRNAELLIGQQIVTAPYLKKSRLEIISTGYMLIDGGVETTVSYISNTRPIPHEKNDIALSTAMAGELLGMKCIYMDAGSGARKSISSKMIQEVSNSIDIPLIVGGGIKSAQEALQKIKAGADVIVIGNAIESNPSLIYDISNSIKGMSGIYNV